MWDSDELVLSRSSSHSLSSCCVQEQRGLLLRNLLRRNRESCIIIFAQPAHHFTLRSRALGAIGITPTGRPRPLPTGSRNCHRLRRQANTSSRLRYTITLAFDVESAVPFASAFDSVPYIASHPTSLRRPIGLTRRPTQRCNAKPVCNAFLD